MAVVSRLWDTSSEESPAIGCSVTSGSPGTFGGGCISAF